MAYPQNGEKEVVEAAGIEPASKKRNSLKRKRSTE